MSYNLQVALGRLVAASPNPRRQAQLSLQLMYNHGDYYLLEIDNHTFLLLPPQLQDCINEVVAQLELCEDLEGVCDWTASNMIKESLTELCQRSPVSQLSNLSNSETAIRPPEKSVVTAKYLDGAFRNLSSITVALCLVNAVYRIEYVDFYKRISHLLQFVIGILLYSSDVDALTGFGVYRSLLQYIYNRWARVSLITEDRALSTQLEGMHTPVPEKSRHAISASFSEQLLYPSSMGESAPYGNEPMVATKMVWTLIEDEMKEMCSAVERFLQSNNITKAPSFVTRVLTILNITLPYLPSTSSLKQINSDFRQNVLSIVHQLLGFRDRTLTATAMQTMKLVLRLPCEESRAALEGMELFEISFEHLKNANCPEHIAVGAIRAVQVLISVGNITKVEPAMLGQFCNVAVELYRNTNMDSVRKATVSLFPFLIKVDRSAQQYRDVYIRAILEPLKNLREMSTKTEELIALRNFIEFEGYGSFDLTTRTNIESILISLLTKVPKSNSVKTGGVTFQSDSFRNGPVYIACWFCLAAISFSNRSAMYFQTVTQKCIPEITSNFLGTGILEVMEYSKRKSPIFYELLQRSVERLAEETLCQTVKLIQSVQSKIDVNIFEHLSPTEYSITSAQQGTEETSYSPKDVLDVDLFQQSSGIDGIFYHNSPYTSILHPDSVKEVLYSLKIFMESLPTSKIILQAQNPSQHFWKKIADVILPLLAHPAADVRDYCGQAICHLIRVSMNVALINSGLMRSIEVKEEDKLLQSIPGSCSFSPTNLSPVYSRSVLISFITDVCKRITLETNTSIQANMLNNFVFCNYSVSPVSTMQRIQSEFIGEGVLGFLIGLLQGSKCVREAALRTLIAIANENAPSIRVQDALTALLSVHSTVLMHISEPAQRARSCAIISLIIKHKPYLVTKINVPFLFKSISTHLRKTIVDEPMREHSVKQNVPVQLSNLKIAAMNLRNNLSQTVIMLGLLINIFYSYLSCYQGEIFEQRRALMNTADCTKKEGLPLMEQDYPLTPFDSSEAKVVLIILWKSLQEISGITNGILVKNMNENHIVHSSDVDSSVDAFSISVSSGGGQKGVMYDLFLQIRSFCSQESQLMVILSTNIRTIEYRLLCSLVDLLAMIPQSAASFLQRQECIDFLRYEYLRSCKGSLIEDGSNESDGNASLKREILGSRNRYPLLKLFGFLGGVNTTEIFDNTGAPAHKLNSLFSSSSESSELTKASKFGTWQAQSSTLTKNTTDPKEEVYPFANDPNFSVVTVYRILVRLLTNPEEMSEKAMTIVLRVSLQLLKEVSERDIPGWDLMEAFLVFLHMEDTVVPIKIKLLAWEILADLIKCHKNAASLRIQDFFATVLDCWDPKNELLTLSLLNVVEELHKINSSITGRGTPGEYNRHSVSAGKEIKNKDPFADDQIVDANNLYLKLADVALSDVSVKRQISYKVVSITSLIENICTVMPIIVDICLHQLMEKIDTQVELKVQILLMVGKLICRFDLTFYVGALILSLYRLIRNHITTVSLVQIKPLLRQIVEILEMVGKPFVMHGSMARNLVMYLYNFVSKLQNILPPFLADATTDKSTTRSDLSNCNEVITLSSPRSIKDRCNIDILVLHIKKAIEEAPRKGQSYEWSAWFYDFQRHVIIHSLSSAFRLCFNLFEEHEPCRKLLFYPAFYCLLTSIFKVSDCDTSSSVPYAANILGAYLKDALSQILKYGNSDAAETCLGLHDYLIKFRSPADGGGALMDENTQYFFINDEEKAAAEKKTNDLSGTVTSLALRRTKTRHQNMAETSADTSFSRSTSRDCRCDEEEKETKADRAKSPERSMTGINTWCLFKMDELSEAALRHRLNYNSTRYLEQLVSSFGTLNDFTAKSDPLKKKVAERRKNQNRIINALAQQYSDLGMQFSVAGLLRSAGARIDASGYELLKCWKEANMAYRLKLEREVVAPASLHSCEVLDEARTLEKMIRANDIQGYIRTLCFCGMWEEGCQFAVDNIVAIRWAASEGDAPGNSLVDLRQKQQGNDQLRNLPDHSAAVYAAACAMVLKRWSDVRIFADIITDTANRALFKNIAAAQESILGRGKKEIFFSEAKSSRRSSFSNSDVLLEMRSNDKQKNRALTNIDDDLKRTMPLSYEHSYEYIVKLQHMQELEEVQLYLQLDGNEAAKAKIRKMWLQRFRAMKPEAFTMLLSVLLYLLAAPSQDITEIVYHFNKTVRQTHPLLGSWAMSLLRPDVHTGQHGIELLQLNLYSDSQKKGSGIEDALVSSELVPSDIPIKTDAIIIDYSEYLWSIGERSKAITALTEFVAIASYESSSRAAVHKSGSKNVSLVEISSKDLGYAHNILGIWKQENNLEHSWGHESRSEILHHLECATQLLPDGYIAWHSWGLMNYRIQQHDSHLTREERSRYVGCANQGFVAAICRAQLPKEVTQDIMRLLQLWIIYGGVNTLKEAIDDAVYRISASLWATCLPQVVAHLSNEDSGVWRVIRAILEKTCKAHPQLCVFSLLLLPLSDSGEWISRLRAGRAQEILNSSCPKALQSQALLVAEGFIALATLPLESICDLVGQALKEMQSVSGVATRPQLETIMSSINKAYSIASQNKQALVPVGDVAGVITVLRQYLVSGGTFSHSLTYCTQLYGELQNHVKELRKVSLKANNSPLSNIHGTIVWIPADYTAASVNPPTIEMLIDRVDIIESKRRARRLHIVGSDGVINTYCLKGNEDLRVDARAMQLFALINSISDDPLCIPRFAVIPLSESVGLLGWVENSETLYNMIRTFRTKGGLTLEVELNIVEKDFGPINNQFHHLCGTQKTEIFDHLFNSVSSSDLKQSIWYRSTNAEMWLKCRTRLTASLASMSSAGYIIGLGDRHPGNVLLQMKDGNVVHIDFGDCFDVARYRSTFPETVPFRLTPMLVNAMEVFGVGGIFQFTCETLMRKMRTNRDSIIALLSAFVYDPVMDKRLSQANRGNVQGVIDVVRRKLRGIEMPLSIYPQGTQFMCWSIPSLTEQPKKIHNTKPITPENNSGRKKEKLEILGAASQTALAHSETVYRKADPQPLMPRPDLQFMLAQMNWDQAEGSTAFVREGLNVAKQVRLLIDEATKIENLADMFPGWTSWW